MGRSGKCRIERVGKIDNPRLCRRCGLLQVAVDVNSRKVVGIDIDQEHAAVGDAVQRFQSEAAKLRIVVEREAGGDADAVESADQDNRVGEFGAARRSAGDRRRAVARQRGLNREAADDVDSIHQVLGGRAEAEVEASGELDRGGRSRQRADHGGAISDDRRRHGARKAERVGQLLERGRRRAVVERDGDDVAVDGQPGNPAVALVGKRRRNSMRMLLPPEPGVSAPRR